MIEWQNTRLPDVSSECEWKAVVGYEGVYEVSRCGKVRRIVTYKGKPCEKERKLTRDNTGYLVTSLWNKKKREKISIHRLVAMAWVEGDHSLTVNHKDGNKLNNHADNLEWMSLADNTRHQLRIGLASQSTCYKPSKVMPEDYPIIMKRINKGESQRAIAKDYECSQPLISWIKKNYVSNVSTSAGKLATIENVKP